MNRKRYASRLTTVALLGLLPMATGACGFIFSHAPPEGHEQLDYFTCTESNAGPIIDVIWGTLNVLAAIVFVADPFYDQNEGQALAFGLSWGTLSGAAAGVGFNKSKKCRAAKRALAQRQAQGQGARREPTGR